MSGRTPRQSGKEGREASGWEQRGVQLFILCDGEWEAPETRTSSQV